MPFDILVMATGSQVIIPQIEGTSSAGVFTLKNLVDAIAIKKYLSEKQCRRVVIVGAGFIAMEVSEALRHRGVAVTIIDRGSLPAHRWSAEFGIILKEELLAHGVEYVAGATVREIAPGKEFALSVKTDQGDFPADLVLLAAGVKPNINLATELGLQIGKTGAIAVDVYQKASLKDVYAVGDCCEAYHRITGNYTYMPLGDIANKQGRVAGRNIGGRPLQFAGVIGAQSFRLFNLEVAATGINEKEAMNAGFNPISNITSGNAIAGSMGKKPLTLQLIADRTTGKLLGAQAVGEQGAVARINALSVALWSGLTIDEISYLDFAYAPPFGGAWDIIHNAAQALRRKI